MRSVDHSARRKGVAGMSRKWVQFASIARAHTYLRIARARVHVDSMGVHVCNYKHAGALIDRPRSCNRMISMCRMCEHVLLCVPCACGLHASATLLLYMLAAMHSIFFYRMVQPASRTFLKGVHWGYVFPLPPERTVVSEYSSCCTVRVLLIGTIPG